MSWAEATTSGDAGDRGLPERIATRPGEDRRRSDRVSRTAGDRHRRAVPLGDPSGAREADTRPGRSGCGDVRERSLHARHRGHLPRRRRTLAAFADGGERGDGAALGRVRGLRHARPLRVPALVSLRGWRRRASAHRSASRDWCYVPGASPTKGRRSSCISARERRKTRRAAPPSSRTSNAAEHTSGWVLSSPRGCLLAWPEDPAGLF